MPITIRLQALVASGENSKMIKFENVSKIYNAGCTALEDINLAIQPKEFLTIAGSSGAGKSTLLKLLTREEVPSSGKILWHDKNIVDIKNSELEVLRRKIGTVFQDIKLLPNKTAYENISFAMEVGGRTDLEVIEDVPRILRLIGLAERAEHFPTQLSGGEKQRIAIGRALAHRPEVLIADEPTGNLDSVNAWGIIRLLVKINELGTTVILASHDREIVNTLEKRVITMEKGKIIRDEEKGRYII